MKMKLFKIKCTAYYPRGPKRRLVKIRKVVEVHARDKYLAIDLARYQTGFDQPNRFFRSYEFLQVKGV